MPDWPGAHQFQKHTAAGCVVGGAVVHVIARHSRNVAEVIVVSGV